MIDALTMQWHERNVLRADSTRPTQQTGSGFSRPPSTITAIDRLSWTPDRYETWLGDLIVTEILAPDPRVTVISSLNRQDSHYDTSSLASDHAANTHRTRRQRGSHA